MAYCVKLSGEDLSRYSNKVESVGLRKCPLLRNVSAVTDGFPSLVLSTVICVDCEYNLIERGQCEYSASGSDRDK